MSYHNASTGPKPTHPLAKKLESRRFSSICVRFITFFYLKGFRIGFLEVSSFKALENENLKQKSAISQKFDSTVVKLLLTSCKIISTEFKFFFYCLGLLMHNDYNLFFSLFLYMVIFIF